MRHAGNREFDLNRLFVSEVIVGKHLRSKRVRYHAKGKGAMMISDTA